MARHVAIFVGDYIDKILRGEKTMEGRFTQDRIAPYGAIKKGDIILLKQAGGKIAGEAEVDNVLFYENLDGEALGKLRKEYSKDLAVDDKFWAAHGKARFATLIFLRNPRRYLGPLRFSKRDRRPWVVVG